MFKKWLNETKGYSEKVSADINSRAKRAKRMLNKEDLSPEDIYTLSSLEEYEALTKYVKSQIKKSVSLYLEFQGK